MQERQPVTIDLTPEGCKTPEGNARVQKAMDAFNSSAHDVANKIDELLRDGSLRARVDSEDLLELQVLCDHRRECQDEFLLAVAGRPPRANRRMN